MFFKNIFYGTQAVELCYSTQRNIDGSEVPARARGPSKVYRSAIDAIKDIPDGATILFGGIIARMFY